MTWRSPGSLIGICEVEGLGLTYWLLRGNGGVEKIIESISAGFRVLGIRRELGNFCMTAAGLKLESTQSCYRPSFNCADSKP